MQNNNHIRAVAVANYCKYSASLMACVYASILRLVLLSGSVDSAPTVSSFVGFLPGVVLNVLPICPKVFGP